MGNWRRIWFSHYLTRTLFPNPSTLLIWQHAGQGTRHFNHLEDYKFFHHWFSGVKWEKQLYLACFNMLFTLVLRSLVRYLYWCTTSPERYIRYISLSKFTITESRISNLEWYFWAFVNCIGTSWSISSPHCSIQYICFTGKVLWICK